MLSIVDHTREIEIAMIQIIRDDVIISVYTVRMHALISRYALKS